MSKSDPLRLPDYLTHILDAILRIERYTEEMTSVEFSEDEKTQDAVIRNFEIIGEACKNIERYHPDFTTAHPEVPWQDAYLLRNQISHGYFKVDLDVVWQTIQNDLPTLAEQIRTLQQQLPKASP